MAKSKSNMQTVANGCVGQRQRIKFLACVQSWRRHRVSRIEVQGLKVTFKEGQRLMIIELRRYNEIWELLIEIRTTGSQGHMCYLDGGWRISVTYGSCLHGGERYGDVNRAQGCIQWLQVWMRAGMHMTTVEQSKKVSMQKMEIDGKERGLGPSGPRSVS